jgi:ketosteroid isomerase-like protein
MSQANVELVRSICAAWEHGDFRPTDWAHPDIEFVIADGPSPGSWTGLEGLADSWRDFLSAWSGVRQNTEEYRELDDERVLVLTRLNARGKTSGVEVGLMTTKQAGLFHVRDGKVTRLIYYLDRERAFAELGVAPKAGARDR